MLIDWFTVIAQIINFLVLVWLLKRYLYTPILKALDERERRVASRLKDADNAKSEAQKEKEEFYNKNEVFDRERKNLFAKVSENAKNEQKRLFDEARKELETFRLKQFESLRKEYQELNQEMLLKTQQEVFAVARKTLSDLADKKLEESIVDVFIRQLSNLDGDEKKKLFIALKTSSLVLVQSVFDLQPAQRIAIENTVKEKFNVSSEFKFENASGLVNGIELIADGYKVCWNIVDYVSSLEKNVSSLLEEKIKNLVERGNEEHAG